MAELWALLIQAQENPTGIPDSLLDVKKEELAKKRVSKFSLYKTESVLSRVDLLGEGRQRTGTGTGAREGKGQGQEAKGEGEVAF